MSHDQEQFERYMQREHPGANLTKHPGGQYAWATAQEAWEIWQAARRTGVGTLVQTGPVDQG